MTSDPLHSASGENEQAEANDLFSKLDSLIQKHQARGAKRQPDAAPLLTDPLEQTPPPQAAEVPVLHDAVDPALAPDENAPLLMADQRRQLQVALYLRLRQRLDQELDAALADDLRLGAVAIHPAFTRVVQELRAVLPIVVRESVEQVFGRDSLEALLGRPPARGSAVR
ncbi:MAG TPA: hypothetical protein VMH26_05800 [Burkholderiales bacterium]|nr:hypothetical protein [Burkholderiales bacterium]